LSAPAPLIVIGAGGHAKVVIELLTASGAYRIVGLTDADPSPRRLLGFEVLGGDDILPRLRAEGVAHAFVALGDNALRQKAALKARGLGFALVNAVSPTASLSPSAHMGVGVAVMAGAVINACGAVGDFAIVNSGAVVDHDAVLGEACHIGPGCALAGCVTIGPRAFLGVGVSVTPNITIGQDTIVGAGACVTADLPAGILALGVPARAVRSLAPAST
jgi:UDP-perosamine 4-acetyltransferase